MFNIKSFLSHIFLFETLSQSELDEFASFCTQVKLPKGSTLFDEGQFVDSFYILAFGRIKLFRLSPTGDENIIHIQGDGDLIAEAAIFDDERYPANSVAIEECLLVKVPSEQFKRMLKNNPELCFKIMSAYAKRLRFLTKKIQDLTANDIKGRLANYLITHSYKNAVTLNIPKKELAASLGTIPETLSRTLQFFKKNGLIEENKEQILIKNPQALKDLVN